MSTKNKIAVLVLAVIFGILLFSSSYANGAATFDLQTQYINEKGDGFEYQQTNVILPDEGYFYVRKIGFNQNNQLYTTSFIIPGKKGTIRYLIDKDTSVVLPLKAGILRENVSIYIETDQYAAYLGQAYVYKDLGRGTIESIGSQPITITQVDNGWRVTYRYTMQKGTYGILWGVGSHLSLGIDVPNQLSIWGNHNLTQSARIGYEGYYYKSPSSYRPSTSNSYWKIPSSYLAQSNIRTGGNLLSKIMGNGLLVLAAKEFNEAGFFPSLPESQMLKTDYGIGAGFFDTRFNSDMIMTYLQAYQKYGIPLYREIYLKMAAYYLEHGKNHHFDVVRNNDSISITHQTEKSNTKTIKEFNIQEPLESSLPTTGWLVWDYADNRQTPNHVSLNHQISAADVFYHLYMEEGNTDYLEFANMMLNGIVLTKDMWMMENHNLEYAFLPNGEMGYTDYPYLTYNDLYNIQETLVKLKVGRQKQIDELLMSKGQWMLRNNIVGYKGYSQ